MTASTQSQENSPIQAKSTSETGHAKNLANFLRLISFCEGYGENYNPSNQRLKISQLKTNYQNALNKLNQVKVQKTAFDNSTNSRRIAFEDLKPFSTKIINAFIVSGADKLTIEDAKAINKKIQGVVLKKQNPQANAPATTISTSQQSYDRKIDHLANLIQVLTQSPEYHPNENELKISALLEKLSDMQTKNLNLINSYTLYSTAMIERNQALYNPLNGIVPTAKEVKLYIKSVYGSGSPQYHQIKNLEFKIRTGE